ncbi:MAG: uroporphyrinogen decarboxylase [Gemmatimonadetes bacterium]|nr:uroporphyrinogen decarboxylase [Gemmatimonadota bacterium]
MTLVETEAVFLRAARGEPVPHTPVWFMRQAGRYMAEYRALREKYTLLQMCAEPELAAEVTLQPIRRFDMDAAILFSDILLPLVPMGLDLEFTAGDGPVIGNPIRSAADVAALEPVEVREDLGHVLEAIRIVRRELDGKVPLIGFAGAPFTIASYAIEGRSSRNFLETKKMMYGAPKLWHTVMEKLTDTVAAYLGAQIEAGAQAVQVFDSWVGTLGPDDYHTFVFPYMKRLFGELARYDVPTIHFGVGTSSLLDLIRDAGGDVIGLDWRVRLDEAWEVVGDRGVQGNLDPVALFAPRDELRRRVLDILDRAAGRPGHIFNLGHGILPGTPVEQVESVVELVHAYRPEERS